LRSELAMTFTLLILGLGPSHARASNDLWQIKSVQQQTILRARFSHIRPDVASVKSLFALIDGTIDNRLCVIGTCDE
jgi:hypothetical protein